MKKIIACILFCALVVCMIVQLTDFLTPKSTNRYYMLEKYLEDNPEQNDHDVQVFGSCHSYTSFNPIYLEERTGASAFVYGNAGEIIPTTYVRMVQQFKKHTPKVALVEIWGMNPYETYSAHDRVFGFYFSNNLERTDFSSEKLEVIRDFRTLDFPFETVDYLSMNFPLMTYKERLMDGSLEACDFDYSFENTQPYASKYTYNEMTSRFTYNGFKKNPSAKIEDYPERQNYIEDGEFLEIESDIVVYLQKIIDLCKENDVELIFYRSPYVSRVNELKKLNHLRQICDENDVLFIDLEEEIQFNYSADFLDYQHFSEIGANKSTEFLTPYILDALAERGQFYHNPSDDAPVNLLLNSDLVNPANQSGNDLFVGTGYTVDGWYISQPNDCISLLPEGLKTTNYSLNAAWHLYQTITTAEEQVDKSITAVFQIEDFSGTKIRPIISCRDADNKEILAATAPMETGTVTVSCVIPEETTHIRVGFWAYDGVEIGNYYIVESIQLFEGAYSVETLPI